MSTSLKKKLLPIFLVIISILILVVLFIMFNKSSPTLLLNKYEDDIKLQASSIISKEDNNLKIIEEFSNNMDLTSEDLSINKKLKLIDDFKNKNGYSSGKIIDAEGDCITTTMKMFKVDKEEPFINAMKGISTATSPTVNKGNGIVSISYTVPIKRNNVAIGALSFTKTIMNII